MSRPEKIKIGPYDIKIGVLDSDGASALWGDFSKHNQQINLMEKYPSPQIEAETLIHEILHVIWWSMQVRPKDSEERIVSMLGVGLTQVIRDNPDLVDWLRSVLK